MENGEGGGEGEEVGFRESMWRTI